MPTTTAEVMVAVDGTDKAHRALPVSMALAALAAANVHLVRVIPPASERTLNQAELIGVDPQDAEGRPEFERQLAETAERLTATSSRAVSWEVLEGTDEARLLSSVAEERNVRAVVMGTRAASAAGLAIAGSVADRVMRECPKPVVLVPPGASDMKGRQLEIERVLVALDGSALAARSVDFLLTLSHVSEMEFVLVEVVHNPHDVPFVQRRLQRTADRFHERSAEVLPRAILGSDVPVAIAAAVREFHIDMIAMSTRGEGGLRRLVLGSVALGVVRAAEVPVLLLTPTMLADGASAGAQPAMRGASF